MGGAEMMSVNIANGLAKQSVESFLCATRAEGDLKMKLDSDIGYLFLNRKGTFDIFAIIKLKRFIKSNRIEVIHAHSSSYFIATIVKVLVPKVKLIWHDHFGGSENVMQRKIQPLNFCSQFFSVIISVNQKLKNWSDNHLKVQDTHYLPNFARLTDSRHKTKLKGNDGKRIVCLAGFRPQKDHLTLLKAFEVILKKHQDWTLHLVGNHNNDDYFDEVNIFIQSNNLSDSIFCYHNVTDVKNIFLQSDIGVLSSKSEGLPVALLEYGLAKLPVVVTDVGECAAVVSKGEFGLVVPQEDKKLLAQKMEELVLDKDARNHLGNNFYNHINENYSEQKIIHKLLDIYSS